MRLGYDKKDFEELGIKIPVNIRLSKKINAVLVAGKSGSGKSCSGRWYIWQQLYDGESFVYIADYKAGEEYERLELSPSYASGEHAFEMINEFYAFFTEVRNQKIRLRRHYTLFIEEWFGLLTYAENISKKLKTDLRSKVGEILAVGRGLNIGIMLCVQRADASLFSTGAREQFQCILSFGRCSAEQFRMLGFSGELEENPTIHYKAGEALALIDGQDSVKEIIVPLIENEDELSNQIFYYLCKQPDIAELRRTVAGGGRAAQ